MSRRTSSGRELIKVLTTYGFVPVERTGSHVKLRYEHPDTGAVRNVSVPMHDEIATGTLRNIAEQAGALDFDLFCEWINDAC